MVDEKALMQAIYKKHENCGSMVMMGMNFVECPYCQFHAHIAGNGRGLVKHWSKPSSYDAELITSVDDARTTPKKRG